ncbi:MAG TPA: CHAD domain-containing protein [Steroidobacteraceae bacterium]|jgi:CHAD domain-containing protein|nr:CHAD domain-containing protein [Steroidobacteraceae bacterium]
MPPYPRQTTPTPTPSPAGGSNAGSEAREVEWQLTAPDLGVVRRWLEQHPRVDRLSIRPLPARQLRDTYLDTGDWRLFRAGFALRLREGAGHLEATLKELHSAREDVADRREITERLSQTGLKALAQAIGPVGSRVRDVAGVKPLRPLFEVRTSRQRFVVRNGNPDVAVGEIALDEARFSRGSRHQRPMLLTRVELEAVGHDSAPLERLAERLRAECALSRATENKFAVGLRSASLVPPRGAGPDRDAAPPVMDPSTRACDFAAAALRRLHQEWQANEPPARLGEGPEPLHRLRVTARRMETILSLFRGYLPAAVRNSRETLKGLLDALGLVRDADIRLEAASSFRSSLPEGDRKALDPLLQYLQSERARARSTMLRALDAKRARDWLDTLPDQLAKTLPATSSVFSRNAAALAVVPDLIHKRFRKLRKSARRLTAGSSMTEFHEVRVRAKKLRYALEVIAPTYAKPANRMLAALHKLQSKLGTQHDADVIAHYLTQLAGHSPANFTAATLFTMGRMAEQRALEAGRMGRKVIGPWRKVRGKRWKGLRSRMQKRRDDAPAIINRDDVLSFSARGNSKPGIGPSRWTTPADVVLH